MGTWRNAGHHKYGAKATVTKGIRFASKAEARRYDELLLLERAGAIRELERQPAFPITVTGPDDKPRIVALYVADFRYKQARYQVPPGWLDVVEDVKGVRTTVYKLKKKLVEAQYGISITEIGGTERLGPGAKGSGVAHKRAHLPDDRGRDRRVG